MLFRSVKPSSAFRLHRDEIRRLVQQSRASNPRVFGSVLCGRDTESSDLNAIGVAVGESTCALLSDGRNAISVTRVEFGEPAVSNRYDMELTMEREKSLSSLRGVIDVGTTNHVCVLTREQSVLCAGAEKSGLYSRYGPRFRTRLLQAQ